MLFRSEVVTFNNVSKFISKVKELNAKIQGLDISPELKNSLRESICLLGRDVAVSINNEKGEKEDALRIAQMLLAEFGDIADLSNKLKEDVNTLDQMLASAKAARKTIWKIFGVIVAIIAVSYTHLIGVIQAVFLGDKLLDLGLQRFPGGQLGNAMRLEVCLLYTSRCV